MTGTITRRGKNSWRLKYDLPRDHETGQRRTAYKTIKGTKKDAERELRKCLSAIDEGIVIEPTRTTVGEYLDRWLDETASHRVTPKSLERYGELIANQIKPHLGTVAIQKLRPADVQSWHSKLLTGGRTAS